MPSKEEKKRRQALLRAMQESRQASEEARMPISKQDLKALLEKIDESVFEERNGEVECLCDHTLRHTREFLRTRSLPEEPIVKWLGEHGGYCDCEVVFNVGDSWGEQVGYDDDDA
jgi:hypothetical protein